MVAQTDRTTRRPVRAIALLLVLQALGLAAAVGYDLLGFDRAALGAGGAQETRAEHAIIAAVIFAPPVALALLGAVGSLFALRWGWLSAELAQGLCLGGCLLLYSEWSPLYIFPAMAYCVLMVLYLNSRDVRVLFHARVLPGRLGAR